jgi:5-methylcytosine-specific restriction protein A
VALKRFCLKRGCQSITDGKYCEQHTQQNHVYDKQRGSAHQRGYDARWRKDRARFLKEHPLCVECIEVGKILAATVVDHIIPHKGDKQLFWNKKNWQALCKRHHDSKTVKEDGGFGK